MLNLYLPDETSEYGKLAKAVRDGVSPISVFGVADSAKAHLTAAVCSERPLLIITQNFISAEKVKKDIQFFTKTEPVLFCPKEILLQAQMQNRSIQQKRIEALDQIASGARIVVAPIDAIIFNLISPQMLKKLTVELKVGQTVDMLDVCKKLIMIGYESVNQIEAEGQFYRHGGMIDVYPFGSDKSVRIDFFGDDIDSIRLVDPISQRTFERIEKFRILPASETNADRESLVRAGEELSKELIKFNRGNKNTFAVEEATNTFAAAATVLKDGGYPTICDQLMAYIYPEYTSLLDYMPKETVVVFDETKILKEHSDSVAAEFSKNIDDLSFEGKVLPRHGLVFTGFNRFFEKAKERQIISLQTISSQNIDSKAVFRIDSNPMQSFHGKPEYLIQEVKIYQNAGYKVIMCTNSTARADRIVKEFTAGGVSVIPLKHADKKIDFGQIAVMQGSCVRGFEYPLYKLAIIAENDIFQNIRQSANKNKSKTSKMDTFVQLSIGDCVVHETNGIGIYQGIVKIDTAGVQKDYLFIKYRDDDKLYVPVEQMHRVQKYIAPDENLPKLSKLGSTEWNKTKARAKKAIADMADKLIEIYKKREQVKGIRFMPDTPWQNDFEEDFPYEETEDQLRCIQEIKADMESDKVMDRLLCGDVGYGKTEVALRAAFKAVMSGKQVAMLAPTTILAHQHFNTFKARLNNFSAVRVECISRFKTAKEQKQILADLEQGKVDILIGTHRLLSKEVKYKDLGLLIVDEEQRFGVAHKEKIKDIKANIDVLTLSATPIPRTLNMALSGIRDMSLLETPPAERCPVQTYVVEYSDSLVHDAILREIQRGGQVYYLYNRVNDIDLFAIKLSKLVPEARIAIGHGQMDEKQLEKVMMDFCNGEYDVLLCTTIIENGVDIPGANTLIVQNAERFGLSQLYQLRGRVGRSSRTAYAYFTVPSQRSLSEDAVKRLAAIEEFTQMGSGFRIAMRDLEIRGAGNLLGGEQHGHMARIGYDLYCKMIKQTVDDKLGKSTEEKDPAVIELKLNLVIPEDYISSESVRFSMYRKISEIQTEDDMLDIRDEMIDRFGDIPESTKCLLVVAYIRAVSTNCGISSIREDKVGNAIISFCENNLEKILATVNEFDACLNGGNIVSVTLKTTGLSPKDKLKRITSFVERYEAIEL